MISILQSNTPGFFYLSLNIIPAILLISLFLLREKNKEPITMVLSTFALTYIIIIPLDLLIAIVDPFLVSYFDNQHFYSLDAFFRAAFLEEFLKFSIIFLFVYKSTYFDEISDGVIYGLTVGLGYAVAENYNYLIYDYYGLEPMIKFIENRWWALTGHVSLGIIMGILIAKSRLVKFKKNIILSLSLVVPIFLHGLHNYTFSSKILFENYVDYYIFGFDIILIIGCLIFLPKLETYKFKYETTNSLYKDFAKISLVGCIFSLLIAIIFGFIN